PNRDSSAGPPTAMIGSPASARPTFGIVSRSTVLRVGDVFARCQAIDLILSRHRAAAGGPDPLSDAPPETPEQSWLLQDGAHSSCTEFAPSPVAHLAAFQTCRR